MVTKGSGTLPFVHRAKGSGTLPFAHRGIWGQTPHFTGNL